MDAMFLAYVSILEQHEHYLIRLNQVGRFRRNQIITEKEIIEGLLAEVKIIMQWITAFGMTPIMKTCFLICNFNTIKFDIKTKSE